MVESLPHAGMKRSYSASTNDHYAHKRRRVHHKLRHVQRIPSHTEPAPQDPVFAQAQLLRSISAALAIAGFDSVQPTALEMFRSHAEEYMLELLSYARTSMQSSRRVKPTVQDFSAALALMPNTRTASLLKPQLDLPIPESVAYPSIPEPDPPPAPAPDFSALLQPLTTSRPPAYIPRHFPQLPPRHAWKQTPVYPDREKDARKMREKATEEGMMAEQALRKLAAAAKAGKAKEERRRSSTLSGIGKVRGAATKSQAIPDDPFADVLKEVGGVDGSMDLGSDGTNERREDGVDLGMPEGVVVNAEMGLWRYHARSTDGNHDLRPGDACRCSA